jgi:hypothetical protein
VFRHRVYSSVASEASVVPCDVIAAARRRRIPTLLRDVITAARRRPRLPAPPRSVCLLASCLADGCLATLRCATPAAQPNSWLTCHNINHSKLFSPPHQVFIPQLFINDPAHFMLFELVVLIIFSEKYRLRSSSLRNFLHASVASSILNLNILINACTVHALSLWMRNNKKEQTPWL